MSMIVFVRLGVNSGKIHCVAIQSYLFFIDNTSLNEITTFMLQLCHITNLMSPYSKM